MSVHARHPSYVADQRAFFDELITEEWDTYRNADWDATRRFEIDQLMRLVRARTVLDIGCGCGFHDLLLAEHAEVVHAIDYSAKSIERAETAYPHPRVKRWASDLREVTGRYDLVFSSQVFEHVDFPDEFLGVCAGLGRTVAISTPNRKRLSNRLRALRRQPPDLIDPQHFREYTPREIARMGAKHGLQRIACFGYGLHGLAAVERWPVEKRLRAGFRWPWIAHGFCIVMTAPASSRRRSAGP